MNSILKNTVLAMVVGAAVVHVGVTQSAYENKCLAQFVTSRSEVVAVARQFAMRSVGALAALGLGYKAWNSDRVKAIRQRVVKSATDVKQCVLDNKDSIKEDIKHGVKIAALAAIFMVLGDKAHAVGLDYVHDALEDVELSDLARFQS